LSVVGIANASESSENRPSVSFLLPQTLGRNPHVSHGVDDRWDWPRNDQGVDTRRGNAGGFGSLDDLHPPSRDMGSWVHWDSWKIGDLANWLV